VIISLFSKLSGPNEAKNNFANSCNGKSDRKMTSIDLNYSTYLNASEFFKEF
jgi:hypothetical protein